MKLQFANLFSTVFDIRKNILLLTCIFCLPAGWAQRSTEFVSADRLFHEGKSMFEDKNYVGCIQKLSVYKQSVLNQDLIPEADYMLSACAYYQGSKNALSCLINFLDTHPVSIHRNEISFMIASLYFEQKEYTEAIHWFVQADLDYLSISQQEEYAYRLAVSYLKIDRSAEAKRLLELLKNNSQTFSKEANYYLGYIHYKEKEYSLASGYFNSIKDNPLFKEEVLYYTTQIHFAQKRYSQTISEGKNLLNLYPQNSNNGEINRIIGLSYFQETDYPEAAEYFKKGLEMSAEYERNDYYSLGLANYFNKQYSDAVRYLNLSNPADDTLGQSIYLYLGQSYLQLQENQNALLAFGSASRMDFDAQAKEAAMYNYAMLLHQNSVSAFGESVTVLEDFINTYPQSIYADKVNDALVDVYLTTKDYQTALNSIAKIKQPGLRILEARQKIYFHLGTIEFTNSNYDLAINNFTKAIEAGNYARAEKEEAIFWRGESYYKQNEYNKATQDFKSFIQTGNSRGNLRNLAQYNLAYCAFSQKQYASAEADFLRFIRSEREPSQTLADAYARLGDCYFYNRRFTEAENAYNQAVSIMPSMGAYALYQKGYVMGLQKNYRGKIEQMNKLIAEYPQSPYVTEALYEKGRSYVLLEDTKAAIESFETLWSQYPESNNARKAGIQMGMLYFNANQYDKASNAYKEIITKYPGSSEARTALQDLKSVYFEQNNVDGYAAYVRSLGDNFRFDASEQDSLTYLAAERFFMRGDNKQAQESLIRYIQSFPMGAFNSNAHYYLGNIYSQDKLFDKAKVEFQAVLDAGSNQFTEESIVRLSEIEFTGKNYETALQLYERLLNITGSQTNKNTANLGILRSASPLGLHTKTVLAANTLLEDESQQPGIVSEAKFHRAKSYLAIGEKDLAEKDLADLEKDTRTSYGAEAKYLLAQYYFDQNRIQDAKNVVLDYIQKGTPHSYWLARSLILLSDIYKSEGDMLQARQYLESLRSNYKNTEDDILPRLNERLTQLAN